MKKNRGWIFTAVAGGLSVVGIWFITPLVLKFPFPIDSSQDAANIGNSFGVTAALFNGLAFLGVLIVLVYEMGERKIDLENTQRGFDLHERQMRPFIVPELGPESVTISRARQNRAGDLTCEITADFKMVNSSSDVALNVGLTSALGTATGKSHEANGSPKAVELPIVSQAVSNMVLTYSCHNDDAKALLKHMANSEPVYLYVSVEYCALNGLKWISKVTYKLSLTSGDEEDIQQIQNGNSEFYIEDHQLSKRQLFLKTEVLGDSWSQQSK